MLCFKKIAGEGKIATKMSHFWPFWGHFGGGCHRGCGEVGARLVQGWCKVGKQRAISWDYCF